MDSLSFGLLSDFFGAAVCFIIIKSFYCINNYKQKEMTLQVLPCNFLLRIAIQDQSFLSLLTYLWQLFVYSFDIVKTNTVKCTSTALEEDDAIIIIFPCNWHSPLYPQQQAFGLKASQKLYFSPLRQKKLQGKNC